MDERKKEIRFLANMITAEINGMYSTQDLTELVAMYGDAKEYLDKMFKMIYHDRFETERNIKMDKQEVYEACKRLVDNDKGYEALACLSKMLEERNTELEILANHKCVVINTVKKFTRIDIPTTTKGLRNRLSVIGDLVEDE